MQDRRKLFPVPQYPYRHRDHTEIQSFQKLIKQFIQLKAISASFSDNDLLINIFRPQRRNPSLVKNFQIFKGNTAKMKFHYLFQTFFICS